MKNATSNIMILSEYSKLKTGYKPYRLESFESDKPLYSSAVVTELDELEEFKRKYPFTNNGKENTGG